jgi:hypothetical protein
LLTQKQLLETPLSWTTAQIYPKQSAGKSLNYDDTSDINNSEEQNRIIYGFQPFQA